MVSVAQMKYCGHCVMPAFAAIENGLGESDICNACKNASSSKKIDWNKRRELLVDLVAPYRTDSNYEVVIGVSGGKDSYFQTHFAIHELGLKPLLVTYHGNNYMPEAQENLDRMRKVFDVDHIVVRPSEKSLVKMNRIGFRLQGDMNWHAHCGIFTVPIQIAARYKVPLILWGEHGFSDLSGMFTLYDFNEFTFRDRVENSLRGFDWDSFTDDGLAKLGRSELAEGLMPNDLMWGQYPSDAEITSSKVRGIYLSNFTKWSGNQNADLMKKLYGWEGAREPFQRTYRMTSNIDDMHENGVHDYLKFVKIGYGRGTDHASKDIREGKISREEGVELVMEYDSVRPTKDLDRWLKYVGITEREFDLTADGFRNPKVWWVENGYWHKFCIDGVSRKFERVAS
jgi:N-acetyl sugar amidotransferase